MDLWDVRKQKEEEKQKYLKELSSTVNTDRIEYVINVILREVREEHRLIVQIIYALFSVYTPKPMNLAINASTGEGKTYAVKNATKYFPAEGIEHIGGMSEKSLFHRKGIIVVREGDDEYVPIDKYTEDIKTQIEELTEQLKEADPKEKPDLRAQRRELEEKLRQYEDEAIKRIDLRQKSLIFQDTPKPELLETIMPLLSHDQERVFYEFASRNNTNGIQTISNMIEGWPSVIYCQAIDSSGRERWPELLRRFIICNPEMTKKKYKGAIDQIFSSSLTKNRYEKEIVTKKEKDTAKGIILDIVETLKDYFMDSSENSVIMPFRDSVKVSFNSEGAFDMNVAEKTHNLLSLLPVINLKERPCLVNEEGKYIPFCTLKDLADTLYINEFVFGGLRQDILKWYISVFYNVWNKKKRDNNLDATERKNEVVAESKPVAKIDELVSRTKEVYGGEEIPQQKMIKKYLIPLINHGYIDELQSQVDNRKKVYYPTSHEIVRRYEIENGELKLVKKLQVKDKSKYPSKRFIAEEINKELRANPNSKLVDMDGSDITIGDLIEKYYPNPEVYFMESKELTASEIDRITRASTSYSPQMDEYYSDPEPEQIICQDCGRILTQDEKDDHVELGECRAKNKSKFFKQ